jgi:hypothetical protein
MSMNTVELGSGLLELALSQDRLNVMPMVNIIAILI